MQFFLYFGPMRRTRLRPTAQTDATAFAHYIAQQPLRGAVSHMVSDPALCRTLL